MFLFSPKQYTSETNSILCPYKITSKLIKFTLNNKLNFTFPNPKYNIFQI